MSVCLWHREWNSTRKFFLTTFIKDQYSCSSDCSIGSGPTILIRLVGFQATRRWAKSKLILAPHQFFCLRLVSPHPYISMHSSLRTIGWRRGAIGLHRGFEQWEVGCARWRSRARALLSNRLDPVTKATSSDSFSCALLLHRAHSIYVIKKRYPLCRWISLMKFLFLHLDYTYLYLG